MKHSFLILFLFGLFQTAYSHPGVGIVKDSQGNIFYTDLKQVWKIAADGSRSVVVKQVHTHHLFMDGKDNLYGEHLWYNGERLDTWGSYAWRLSRDGSFDTVLGPIEGFLENYSFYRDAAGNHYWVDRGPISRIKKKQTDGTVLIIAEGKFKDVREMLVTPEGRIYFIDLTDLWQIDGNGKPVVRVHNLSKPGIKNARHSIFGLWTDKAGNIYAAVYSERRVKKISAGGQVSGFVYSVFPWAPTGGVFDEQGNLWLMETNIVNEVRVRKISAHLLGKKPGRINALLLNTILPSTLLALLLVLAVLGILRRLERKRHAHS